MLFLLKFDGHKKKKEEEENPGNTNKVWIKTPQCYFKKFNCSTLDDSLQGWTRLAVLYYNTNVETQAIPDKIDSGAFLMGWELKFKEPGPQIKVWYPNIICFQLDQRKINSICGGNRGWVIWYCNTGALAVYWYCIVWEMLVLFMLDSLVTKLLASSTYWLAHH